MSHYDLELVEDILDDLNGFSLGVLVAYALLCFAHAVWVACSLIGTGCGVFLWLLVHAA